MGWRVPTLDAPPARGTQLRSARLDASLGVELPMDAEQQPDPFKFFAEQEASYWASSKYRDRLVELARQQFAATGESVGGLVVCAGAPLGKVLARAAPADRRPDPERQDCVTAMPRPDFDGFVRLTRAERVQRAAGAGP